MWNFDGPQQRGRAREIVEGRFGHCNAAQLIILRIERRIALSDFKAAGVESLEARTCVAEGGIGGILRGRRVVHAALHQKSVGALLVFFGRLGNLLRNCRRVALRGLLCLGLLGLHCRRRRRHFRNGLRDLCARLNLVKTQEFQFVRRGG